MALFLFRMPTTDHALDTVSVPGRAVSESVPNDLEFCCSGCGGFLVALELPTHRMEQSVTVYLRYHCKRCRKRNRRRVIIEAGPSR